ncbi:hypothetical protein [Tolypothrix sp. VBCCA 56010]|uniref:hypothetical protein n=1 Tax=Tolypothrix sp. VBCCA 56010 TaxID=3137731 RepID=UPI003D7D8B7B
MSDLEHISPEVIDQARRKRLLRDAAKARRLKYPAEWLEISRPTPANPWANQWGYLTARQRIRVLTPGNRWGKTTAMGLDAHETAMLSGRFQPALPRPALMIWFCKRVEQFEIVWQQLSREVFGACARWKNDAFTWENGSKLYVAVADKGEEWKNYMGIEADRFYFDEIPKMPHIYREMFARRTTARDARITISGTVVDGTDWTEEELFHPWLAHHGWEAGELTPEMCLTQNHPKIWYWPHGGIRDNPAQSREVIEDFESQTWGGDANIKKVRNHGGYARIGGLTVFDAQATAWMRAEAQKLEQSNPSQVGVIGIAPCPKKPTLNPRLLGRPLCELDYNDLKDLPPACFVFKPDRTVETITAKETGLFRGQVRMFEPPKPNRQYVAGLDAAYGVGRDWDVLSIFDKTGTRDGSPLRQVLEARGQWGPNFHPIVYALLRMYNDAWLLPERQVGHFTIRVLWDNYAYRAIYRELPKDAVNQIEPANAKLGWPKAANDHMVSRFREAVARRRVLIRSAATLAQMDDLRWQADDHRGHEEDWKLRMTLSKGSPDLVWAAGYGYFASEQIVLAPKPRGPIFAPGTIGADWDELQKLIDPENLPDWLPRPS